MQYRELGRPMLKVSVICLGTAWFGHWVDAQPVDEYRRIVDYAIDAGINFIDTAEGYDESEGILGEVLRGRRDEVILATKISMKGARWDYDTMRRRLEGSLKRLQTDYMDLYQIHNPPEKDKDYEDIHTSMERLKREGLIKVAGVSNFRLRHLKKFRDEAFEVIVTDQVPYNLLWRVYDEPDIIDFCRRKGLRYLAYSSLAQGLLTGKYGKDTPLADIQRKNVLFNEPVYSRAMKVFDVVREVAEEVDATPAQVALKWVIERELTGSALVGIRNVKELEENVKAISVYLTREQRDRLDKVSLEFWAPMPSLDYMWIRAREPSGKQ